MPRSSRQRQSRLTFTPLPSSSPATRGYDKQIQNRAAAVTLDSSPRSKRHIPDNAVNDAMPTPASDDGLQVKAVEGQSESEDEPIRHSQRRKSGPRQQKLDFSNVRDPSSFSPPMKLSSSSSKPQSSTRAGMFGTRQSQRAIVNISSESESSDDEELPSPRKLLSQSRSSSDSRTMRTTRIQRQPILEESDAEGDTIAVKAQSSPIQVESDDDSEDAMPTTAGTQRRKRAARRGSPDSFVASSPPQMSESEDDLEIIEPPNKRRRTNCNGSDEDEDDGSQPHTPPRRRLKPSRKLSQREQKELNEELDFLGPSSDVEKSARKSRESREVGKSARQKALEALKRKRAGSVRTNEQNDDQITVSDNDNEDDVDQFGEDDDAYEYVQPTRSSQMFQEDEEDQDFIESDGEGDLGVLDDLPLEFTRHASKKPKELFVHAVEWFVQKKINPAFQIDDAIYELAFRKLDDEVTGLARSKFKSSAWKDEFVYTLNARPEIAYQAIDRMEAEHFMRDSCDACGRSGHPATYEVQFHGNPYHRQTLEDLDGNEEDDDDDDAEDDDMSPSDSKNSDEPTYDAEGHLIPPESKTWYVGKFCMSNTRTAHALQHWRYHLNEYVITWLASNGYNNPDKLAKRDSWSTEKRRIYANGIVNRLVKQGVVKDLYGHYKNNINEARDSKQGRYRGGWE